MQEERHSISAHTHTPLINLAFGTAGSHNSSATVCVGGVTAALNQRKLIAL